MMWDVPGKPWPTEYFGGLEPLEVLYEFDGPRIFTAVSTQGAPLLVYQCAESEVAGRFLVVPTGEEVVRALREGRLTVLEALQQPWAWLVERAHEGPLIQARSIEVRMLPEEALPRPGVFLLPSQGPLLSVRLVGEGLGPGTVAASVIRRAVEGASGALSRDLRPVKLSGFIREFDKDRLTFTLRDQAGLDLRKCSFSELLYDYALAAFDAEACVTVLGHESLSRGGHVEVVSIDRTPQ